MIKEAEKHKAEDEAQKKKIEKKNGLEQYIYQVKNTLDDPKLKEKFSEEDKKTVLDAVTETEQWFNSNQMATTEEFEEQKKKLETVFNPIIAKVY